MNSSIRCLRIVVACACITLINHPESTHAAVASTQLVTQLQDRLGLTEAQVRGALGALLVFVRERLPEPEFKDLARSIPNAEYIMQDVKLRGIVTGPLDNLDEYQAALASLGIGEPLAAQVVPAVLDALAANGLDKEREILARAVD